MRRYCDDDGAGFKLDQKRFGIRCERMTIVPRLAATDTGAKDG